MKCRRPGGDWGGPPLPIHDHTQCSRGTAVLLPCPRALVTLTFPEPTTNSHIHTQALARVIDAEFFQGSFHRTLAR